MNSYNLIAPCLQPKQGVFVFYYITAFAMKSVRFTTSVYTR